MKRNNLLKLIALAAVITVLACVALLTGCNKSSVSAISISTSSKPREVYVQGQELELKGAITAIVNNEPTTVPLNSPDVTVEGYDPQKLGKQTLTVTYNGQTTTFEVNVVARMSAEGYETDYFVNDEFNLTKGKLKIMRDNAVPYTKTLDDSKVKIDFSSKTAGKVDVKVSYTETNGDVYETTFTVNVHEIGEVTLTKPYKKTYNSHDTAIDTTGGYFTVKAKGSDFSKDVPLTPEMGSGFEPEKVTIENRDEPAQQTIVFTYGNTKVDFPITVYYSSFSIVKDRAEELSVLDWSGESVEVSEELGLAAVDGIKEYYKLTDVERRDLSDDEKNAIIRAAAVYLNRLFAIEFSSMSNVFGISSEGYLVIVAESYEATKAARAKIYDEEDNYSIYAELLRKIVTDFEKTVLLKSEDGKEITVGSYVFVTSKDGDLQIIETLDQIIKAYDILAGIEEWSIDTLESYKSDISRAVRHITDSEYKGLAHAPMYVAMSKWREADDYFDIIFSYYLYVAEDGENVINKELWEVLPLPGRLQDWYAAVANASYTISALESYKDAPESNLFDTSDIIYLHFESLRLCEEIKNGDDKLAKDLFEMLGGDALTERYVEKASFGYLFNMGEALGNEKIEALWDKYLELYEIYFYTGTEEGKTYDEEHTALFEAFASLSPAEVYAFLSSMHFRYDLANNSKNYETVLDYSKGAKSDFVFLVANYYLEKIPESTKDLFQDLLLAIETYALIPEQSTAADNFKTIMTRLSTNFAALSNEDEKIFEDTFGDIYGKYLTYYNELSAPTVPDDSFIAKLDKLYETLKLFFSTEKFFSENSPSADDTEEESAAKADTTGVHAIVFALYENAYRQYEALIAEGGYDLHVLFTKTYAFDGESITLDKALYNARATFIGYMLNSTITSTDDEGNETVYMAWDIYHGSGLEEFLADNAFLLLSGFDENYTLTADELLALLAKTRNTDPKVMELVFSFDVSHYYYMSIELYFTEVLTEEELELAKATLMMEIEYIDYLNNPDSEEAKAAFEEAAKKAADLFAALGETEGYNTYIKDLYEFYIAEYTPSDGPSDTPD